MPEMRRANQRLRELAVHHRDARVKDVERRVVGVAGVLLCGVFGGGGREQIAPRRLRKRVVPEPLLALSSRLIRSARLALALVRRHAGAIARARSAAVQSALVTPATRISARNPAIVRGTAFSGFAGMSFVLVAARTAARRWSAELARVPQRQVVDLRRDGLAPVRGLLPK